MLMPDEQEFTLFAIVAIVAIVRIICLVGVRPPAESNIGGKAMIQGGGSPSRRYNKWCGLETASCSWSSSAAIDNTYGLTYGE
jgi:hypothetical protein